ncbi:MAG: NACHT domain-containing protein, partial [Candidatus Brocadiaceae bacterium]|nr:NACHT domain-containing protein [Candidatus Brocadiaceae bacterium]
MKNKEEINVFIASPGDVKKEREIVRNVCEWLNKSTLLKPYGISFLATGWEEVIPSAGRPQEIINKLVDDCDIFVCVFHKRFGSPTGKEEAGTLEEYLNAYDSWKEHKKPHIMFYFKKVEISSLKDLEDPQLKKVFDLKEKIDQEKSLLFSEFSTPDEFREKIRDHLEQWTVENSKGWKKIGDKIEKAFEEEKIFKNYLQAALNEYRLLQTQGFETTLRVPIELEKVYINMKAQIHTHDAEFTLRSKEKIESRNREEDLSSLDIKAAFETSERLKVKDMVILGDPGSGKTTLLKYILVLLIEGRGSERLGITERQIPFFAPLRELQNPETVTLAEFISKYCNLDDYSISIDSFNKLLDDGRGIILLDGLDEVANEEERIKACEWIDRARRRYPNTNFVITSRYAGYLGKSRLNGNVLELSIQDFSMDEVREFLTNW